MNSFKPSSIKGFFLRILRLLGALALIYCSMVFYLALTERQIAFPRAITHKEANAAIQGKAKQLSCTLEDGNILSGWQLGSDNKSILLYFPDTDEDGAQFLAEAGENAQSTLVTFNYRGSGNNKGTPSSENFLDDARQITACASQITGRAPEIVAGRGIGAILAAEQLKYTKKSSLFLIDPISSIADKINEKYRLLYPKFLIRTKVDMPDLNEIAIPEQVILIQDRQNRQESNLIFEKEHPNFKKIKAQGSPLSNKLNQALQHLTAQTR